MLPISTLPLPTSRMSLMRLNISMKTENPHHSLDFVKPWNTNLEEGRVQIKLFVEFLVTPT